MIKNLKLKLLRSLVGLTVGAVLYSLSISLFLDPHNLAPGGVGGISILLNRLLPMIDTGAWVLILNIPLLIIGLWKFGKSFLLYTVYATVLSSVMIDVESRFMAGRPMITENVLLAALAGGALLALGVGIVFRSGGTTGGTDILIKLLRQKFRYLKSGTIMMLSDAVVIALSIPVLGSLEPALYAAVSLATTSYLFDKVLYGTDGAKLYYIISDCPDAIAKRILAELDLGATYLSAEGAYTGEGKRVLLCAARKQLAPRIRDIVREEDPAAFLILSPATEVVGEGFKSQNEEEI